MRKKLMELLKQRDNLEEWVATAELPNSKKKHWGEIAKRSPRYFESEYRCDFNVNGVSVNRVYVRIHPDLRRFM